MPLAGPDPNPLLLIAEHHTPARPFLADNFIADGYDVVPAADYDGAVRALLGTRQIDAMLVDLGADTLRLIDAIRRDDHRLDAGLPILAFVASPDAMPRVRMLERGAEDVMAKPFSYPELRLRVARVLANASGRPAARASIQVGPLHIDTRRRAVTVDGVDVLLTNREYELLMLLVADPTRTYSREELTKVGWGYAGRTRALDTACVRLRRKLGHSGHRFISNVWGVGYRFVEPTQLAVWGQEAA